MLDYYGMPCYGKPSIEKGVNRIKDLFPDDLEGIKGVEKAYRSLHLQPAFAPPSRHGPMPPSRASLPTAPCCAGRLDGAHFGSSEWTPAVHGGAHRSRRQLQREEQCTPVPPLSSVLDLLVPKF